MRGRGKVALIADDDEFFRIALRTILKNELGFEETVETGSLDESIERLSERHDVSLALFDLAMPGMESAANLEAVRGFPRGYEGRGRLLLDQTFRQATGFAGVSRRRDAARSFEAPRCIPQSDPNLGREVSGRRAR
jgi:CheY-like chemotaxis protein